MLKATKGFTKGNLTLFQYFFIKSEQKSFYEHSPRGRASYLYDGES